VTGTAYWPKKTFALFVKKADASGDVAVGCWSDAEKKSAPKASSVEKRA